MNMNQKLKLGKETVAMMIKSEPLGSSDYGNVTISVVYVKEDGKSIGYYDNYFDQKNKYKGLTYSCQVSRNIEVPYACRLFVDGCDFVEITLDVAKQAVKTMSPIQKKLDKIANIEGETVSFEDMACRLARVIGAKAFFYQPNRDNSFHSIFSINTDMTQFKDAVLEEVKWCRPAEEAA